METVAVVLALLGTSAMLAYIGSQFKTSSDGGSRYAAVMKILFNSTSFITLLGVPIAAMSIAESVSMQGLKQIAEVTMVPVGFLFIVYVFYLLWEYLSDLIKVMSGSQDSFQHDEFG